MLTLKVKEDITELPGVKCYSIDVGTIKERYIREATIGSLSKVDNDFTHIKSVSHQYPPFLYNNVNLK